MTTEEQHEREQVKRRTTRARVAGPVAIAAVIAALGLSFMWGQGFQQSAQRAQEQTLSLTQEIQLACAEGEVTVSGRNLCQAGRQARAQVEADVVAGPAGPVGPVGPRGIQGESGPAGADGKEGPRGPEGEDGDDSTVPGPKGEDSTIAGPPGEDGTDGEDSAVAGPAGEPGAKGDRGPAGERGATGATGATGPAGPAGKDSTVPGPAGPAGPVGATGQAGSAGVGIADIQCVGTGTASYWSITLTDGTKLTSDGPCKAVTTQEPAPTTAP